MSVSVRSKSVDPNKLISAKEINVLTDSQDSKNIVEQVQSSIDDMMDF